MFLGTEDVDQCGIVQWIDMLRVERQPGFGQRFENALLHSAEAEDRGE